MTNERNGYKLWVKVFKSLQKDCIEYKWVCCLTGYENCCRAQAAQLKRAGFKTLVLTPDDGEPM